MNLNNLTDIEIWEICRALAKVTRDKEVEPENDRNIANSLRDKIIISVGNQRKKLVK